uniref:Putative secreted protein n=1 Tax=Anopheles darlingi TaxID=43151 RepID=A0A2M4D0I0_ANODA
MLLLLLLLLSMLDLLLLQQCVGRNVDHHARLIVLSLLEKQLMDDVALLSVSSRRSLYQLALLSSRQ